MTLSILDAVAEVPGRTALRAEGSSITFAELGERVERRLPYLESKGMPLTDLAPALLVGSSDLETLELIYAAVEIGQPLALVHPRLTGAERKPLFDMFPADRILDARATPVEKARRAELRSRPDDEAPLAVVFTSGTTGRPKGVVLSRRAFAASARASAENLGWQDGDRWLLGLPLAHVGGLSIVTRCLIARRTVVVPPEVSRGNRLDAAGIARTIDEQGVTLVSLVPTQLEWLLARDPPWVPPAHLRAVLLGGAPARPALLERAADRGVPVLTTYGLTEACSQVTTQPYGTVNRGELGAGLPIAGTEIRLAPDGAIEIRGPTLLSGYFPGVAAAVDAGSWFRTDDVGRLDERGMLHVIGRRSECIITGGENVFPAEVESVLEQCPAITSVCVFGVPDDTWGEVLAAVIVPSGRADSATIAAFMRERLASHRRPRLMAFAESLALTENGKLDRRTNATRARGGLRRLPETDR